MTGQLDVLDPQIIDSKKHLISNNQKIESDFINKKTVLRLHDNIRDLEKLNIYPGALPDFPSIVIVNSFVAFTSGFKKPTVLPVEFLLCVCDRIEASFSLNSYILLSRTNPTPLNLDFLSLYNGINTLLMDMCLATGNEAYRGLKYMEAITVGVIHSHFPEWICSKGLENEVLDDLHKKAPSVAEYMAQYARLVDAFLSTHQEQGVESSMELYGLEKAFWYPIEEWIYLQLENSGEHSINNG